MIQSHQQCLFLNQHQIPSKSLNLEKKTTMKVYCTGTDEKIPCSDFTELTADYHLALRNQNNLVANRLESRTIIPIRGARVERQTFIPGACHAQKSQLTPTIPPRSQSQNPLHSGAYK